MTPSHRQLAKGAYWLAVKLARIKTPQRTYTLDGTFARTMWLPCKLSMKLIHLAMRLDWDHFDHWTCEVPVRCVCRGR